MLEVGAFYDALAPWYHLVYQDWEASIAREGRALSSLVTSEWGSATASTVSLRVGDLVTLAALGAAAGGTVLWSLAGPWFAVSLTLAAAAGGAAWWWLRRAVKGGADVRLPTLSVLAATGSAWLLEAVLVMEGAHLVGLSIGYQQALLVTATTVCAQVAAVAPSGLGTFEAAGTATFVALGYGAAEGLAATVVVHAISTAYSLFAAPTVIAGVKL